MFFLLFDFKKQSPKHVFYLIDTILGQLGLPSSSRPPSPPTFESWSSEHLLSIPSVVFLNLSPYFPIACLCYYFDIFSFHLYCLPTVEKDDNSSLCIHKVYMRVPKDTHICFTSSPSSRTVSQFWPNKYSRSVLSWLCTWCHNWSRRSSKNSISLLIYVFFWN